MAKTFDNTLKELFSTFALDWARLFGREFHFPDDIQVKPLDVDLKTVQVSADQVFELQPPGQGLLHLEPQSSWDDTLAGRLLHYHVALHERYGGPIYSVVLLLRRSAQSKNLTGEVVRAYHNGDVYLQFRYALIRVWEWHCDDLLLGSLGTLPLAVLTDDAATRLAEVVVRIEERLHRDGVAPAVQKLLTMSSFLLSGLRYNANECALAFARVNQMRESSTYQMILEEGRQKGIEIGEKKGIQEGQLQTLQGMLREILEDRFTKLPKKLQKRIEETTDLTLLRSLVRQAASVISIQELKWE